MRKTVNSPLGHRSTPASRCSFSPFAPPSPPPPLLFPSKPPSCPRIFVQLATTFDVFVSLIHCPLGYDERRRLSQAPTLCCNVDLAKTLDCARRQSRVCWRSGCTSPSSRSSSVGDVVGTKAKTMSSSTNIHPHGSSVEVVLLLLSAQHTRVTSIRVLTEPKTTSTGAACRL